MQTQPSISFDDVAVNESVRDAALAHVHELETLSRDIVGCHVVVSQPHRHHRRGRLWAVRIDLVVPGADIVVNRTHRLDHAHEDPLVALRDAFAAARRRLEERLREERGEVKAHCMHDEGRVLRVFPQAGYGFLGTPDGREVYFHAHALADVAIGDIAPGTPVRFTVEEGDDGPQATWVHPCGAPPAREEAR